MKQPKFRGFSIENNSWHYGHGWFEIDYTDDYLKEKGINQRAMLYTEGHPVECELRSMGQFTGIKDKHGVEAYNGDLFYWHGTLRRIVYREDKGAFMATPTEGYKSYFYLNDLLDRFEIIGNETMHQNLPFTIS